MLARLRDLVGPRGVAYVSTPNVLTLAPSGRGALRQPVARARVPARRSSARCASATSARVDLLGLFHARKLRLHELALERAGWDAVHARLRITKPFYDRFTPAISARDFGLRARRPRRRAGPARRAAAMSRAPGALAIVLHTHMPYVEGFGTWPFGEEWLWEAIATCYLPLLDVLDERAGPRHALGHAGARATSSRRPARSSAAWRSCARSGPSRTGSTSPRARPRRGRRRSSTRAARYARGGRGARARRPRRRGSRRTRAGPRRRPTPCCRCSRRDAGVRLQLATGIAAHRARFGRLGRRLLAARVRARAVARRAARGGRRARDVRRPDRRARPRHAAQLRRCARRPGRCWCRSTAR